MVRFSFKNIAHSRGNTLFEDVKYVEPAKTAYFNHELKFQENIYWSLDNIPEVRYQTDDQYIEHFRELFDNAVKTRLPKTTKTGIFLSSGYDSTAVASYAASYLQKENKKLYGFTSVPAYYDLIRPSLRQRANEQSLVESFAQGIPNLNASFDDFKSTTITNLLLSDISSDLNWPQITPNILWLDGFLQKAKAKGIDRMLNGQRGNVFISWHGPHLHSSMLIKGQWRTLFNEINSISKVQKISRYEVIKSHLYNDFKKDLYTLKSRIKLSQKNPFFCVGLLNDEIIHSVNWKQLLQDMPFIPNYSALKSSKNIRKKLTENGILKASGPWHALAQRHKVVITDPTSDIRVATFSFGIPESLWYKNGIKRYLYREAFKHRIPESILNSPLTMIQSADISIRLEKDTDLHLLINQILSGDRLNGLIDTKKLETNWLKFSNKECMLNEDQLGMELLNQISFYTAIKKCYLTAKYNL